MKPFVLCFLMLLAFCVPVFCQTPTAPPPTVSVSSVSIPIPVNAATVAAATGDRFAAAGLGYFSQAVPQFQGWAAMALPLTSDGKALSYTDIDIAVVPSNGQTSPAQLRIAGQELRFSLRTGVAYRLYQPSNGAWALFGLAAPGFAATGTAFASAFEYGGFITKSISPKIRALVGVTNEHYGTVSDLAPRVGLTVKF